jgi:hypothetical protein
VPADLASAFTRARGVDVSSVPVYRDATVTAQAQALRARAFTRDGAVFLPSEAGSLGQRTARALLAHELAHVAQQELLGKGPPEEGSPDGLALEADAMATERWTAGDAAPPPPLADFPGVVILPAQVPVTHARNASPTGAGTPQRAPLHADAPPVPASPAPADPAAAGIAARAPAMIPAALPQPQPQPSAPPEAAVTVVQAPPDTELAAARGRLLALAAQRPLDMDDPADLDELARRLYPKLHRELRLELLVDRERSGLLSDIR